MLPAITRWALGALSRWWLLFLVLAGSGTGAPVMAGGPFNDPSAALSDAGIPALEDSLSAKETLPHLSRALAAALAVTLGPFGAHRLYLGTTPKVPLLYGLTFGGFGVLVLIDLGHILFTRDLSAYRDDRQVLMWAKPRKGEGVTPP